MRPNVGTTRRRTFGTSDNAEEKLACPMTVHVGAEVDVSGCCRSLCCTVPNERGCVVHLSLIRVVRVGCLMRSRCAFSCLLLVLFCMYHSRRESLLYVYIWACLDAQDLELDMLSE